MTFAAVLLLVATLGCEPAMEVSDENVVGTWQGRLDHMPMTFTFNEDSTFTYRNGNPVGGGQPGMTWVRSGYADLPMNGKWRIAAGEEPELVWMLEDEQGSAMANSAFVRSLSATQLKLQIGEKPPVTFERK